ncbi:MAG: IS21-like element helper ATPase IstB [Pseudomonadota bacterium]
MIEQTIEKLHNLNLPEMARELELQLQDPTATELSFMQRFANLVQLQWDAKKAAQLSRAVRSAAFEEPAYLNEIRYSGRKGLDRATVEELASCSWIRGGGNLLFTGPTGTGKTWLACALGHEACKRGFRVRFERLTLLLEKIRIANMTNSFGKELRKLGKFDLLILDDLGASALSAENRTHLMEIVNERCHGKSTIVTSQLPFGKWHGYISGANPTVSDGIMDRLSGGARLIELDGDSMRGGVIR